MTKPKKPTIPRQPAFLDESPKQTYHIYQEQTSYPSTKKSLYDMIYDHAQKNEILLNCYNWQSIEILTSLEDDYGGEEFCLIISCDVNIDIATIEKIKRHNKALLIEWEAKNNIYLEKLRTYEALLQIYENSEAGQKASRANQIKKLRAETSTAIEKLTNQLKHQKITPEQFIMKMEDIRAIGTIHDLSD